MTSLGESSLGSVRIPDIAALQSHLLQNGEPSAAAQTPCDTTESGEPHASRNLSQPAHDTVFNVATVPAPRDTLAVPPSLTPSRSAPAEIDAMIRRTPSQDVTMSRALSFNGYDGGDTQPMESQIYRDYTESMTRSSGTTPKKMVLHFDAFDANAMADQNTYGTTSVNGRTQHTMDQGDDGFVDLEGAWHPENSPGAKSATSGIEELLAGPETQSQNNIGANGSYVPRTPGLAGDQRRRSGDIPTSATNASRKTPAGFSQMFAMGSKLSTLSATQLFDQTQAPSSPTVDAAHSDPIADRPSPNMNHNGGLSPNVASSSPMLMMRNIPASTAGEPRDTYTSMRESQERRAARLRQELELQNKFGPDAIAERRDDDDDDTQQMRLERQRLHRVLSDQANDEWSRYRAPSRPGHRSASASADKRTATIDLVTPGTLQRPGRVQFDLLDDDQETDDDDEMEMDLPAEAEDTHDGEGVPDVEGMEDNQDDNDVYDEYGQTVLRSQRDPDDEEDEPHGGDDENNGSHIEDMPRSQNDVMADDDEAKQDVNMGGIHDTTGETAAGTQPAVADSQPERLEAQRSLLVKDQQVTSSVIPGSQYVGATSQDLARQTNRVPNSSTLSQHFALESSRSRNLDNRVPSSPPVPDVDAAEQRDEEEEEEDADDSPAKTETPSGSKPGHQSFQGIANNRREIPESDQPDRPDNNEKKSAHEETLFETANESNVVAPFSTAQTHLDDSAHTPEKPRLVKELSKTEASQQSMPTPLRAAGVRRFADIAADPSPPEFSAESQLDMDAIMGNVISMDDQNFMDVLSSPPSEKPTKRRRLLPSDSSRRRSRLPSMGLAGSEPASESAFESSSPGRAASVDRDVTAPPTAPVGLAEASRSSPNKAYKVPSATPEEAQAPDTPESVRRREEAGSKAASQLLSARPAFAPTVTKLRYAKSGRKASATCTAERKPVSRRVSSKLKHVVEEAAAEDSSETIALPNSDHPTHGTEPNVVTSNTEVLTQRLTIDAPDRVLARFTGVSYNAYYPATWLSTAPDGRSHVIRFDDTTVTTVDAKDVRALDLRIDDLVRIDYEGFRSKTWLIKSFGRKALNQDDRAHGVDMHGHVTLHVQAKVTQRNSVPAPGAVAQGEGEIAEIMVTNVKITHNMIVHFADRTFYPPNGDGAPAQRNQTPSTKEQSFDAVTPSRSTRRAAASTTKSVGNEPSRLREESVATTSEASDAGMFEGMAFAISYAGNEAEKFDVTRLIRRNGGLILEQGFDELFVQPQLDDQTTPTKRSGRPGSATQTGIESGSLRLNPEYKKLGFIALIADKHSRRAKYMQALALDLPTLSGRWIIDSFDSSRNYALPTSPRPWTRYLLPAGESSYLGGAIRSRTLQYYNPTSAKLPATVASRALLLGGAGVLLVAPKKGKGTWERRKAYAFLTLALGAGSVRRVADLAEARKLLASDVEKQKWAWVYVDDDAAQAAKVLFGAKRSSGAGRKRKRNDGAQMCVEGMQGRVRVVGDEFVVQSLILGALVD